MFQRDLAKALFFYVSEIIITSFLFVWLFKISSEVGSAEIYVKGIFASFFTLGALAYLFGLRHAVDADHLAAIDNSTRKLVQEKKPSLFTDLFFSLVTPLLLSIALMIATRTVESSIPQLENICSIVDTLGSGLFLYIIGFLNLIVFFEIYELFKQAKKGKLNEEKLYDALLKRGFIIFQRTI
ncbi:hypothetical protein HS5_15050 [Acidianus sp. HS-5]|nr:hypothetical protein HS5_15050 [Acidianus sp. HS-5]